MRRRHQQKFSASIWRWFLCYETWRMVKRFDSVGARAVSAPISRVRDFLATFDNIQHAVSAIRVAEARILWELRHVSSPKSFFCLAPWRVPIHMEYVTVPLYVCPQLGYDYSLSQSFQFMDGICRTFLPRIFCLLPISSSVNSAWFCCPEKDGVDRTDCKAAADFVTLWKGIGRDNTRKCPFPTGGALAAGVHMGLTGESITYAAKYPAWTKFTSKIHLTLCLNRKLFKTSDHYLLKVCVLKLSTAC